MDARTLEETRAYRSALGCFATGVAVITAAQTQPGPQTEGQGETGSAWAITVNSFTSISLRPRLVLWSLGLDAERYALFAEAEVWGVSVLGAEDEVLSARFAAHGAAPAEAQELDRLGASLVLKQALARFDCRTVERRTIGDHLVIVGETLGFDCRPGDGLTYFRGRYGALKEKG